MSLFSRKSRRNKKPAANQSSSPKQSSSLDVMDENPGYDPYDTLPGVSRDKLGMRRRNDGKWSF